MARNIAYHRHFKFADNRSNSRAPSQVRLFDRGFANTPVSDQQCASSPAHWRTSEDKTILAAASFKVSLPGPLLRDGACGALLRCGISARLTAANGMVRPCSSPASVGCWQGAPKTRSTPCYRSSIMKSP